MGAVVHGAGVDGGRGAWRLGCMEAEVHRAEVHGAGVHGGRVHGGRGAWRQGCMEAGGMKSGVHGGRGTWQLRPSPRLLETSLPQHSSW